MIHVTNLYKSYGAKSAVRGISFTVEPGEIFGFLGPNGAGKSTTIKVLTGQLTPTSGQVEVLGRQLPSERSDLVREIGVSPESTNLYERLSVRENLELFCSLYDAPARRGLDLLEQVGLQGSAKTPVKKLSKGMKQRVLLIRSMLHNPKLLFLDEPTSGLDPASANEIHHLLRSLNGNGTTIFLTTHNMDEADMLCHRVAFINEGQIAEIGRPEDLKRTYGEGGLELTLAEEGQQVTRRLPLSGEETGRQVGAWLADGRVLAIHSVESTLTDIFIRLTGRKSI